MRDLMMENRWVPSEAGGVMEQDDVGHGRSYGAVPHVHPALHGFC
jgi:hypothetical protein